uniref:Methionine aminopeptidase n=1 Tax=Chromera velia CCMP2878 TaxID=1169474 RepID=A0A0G4HYE1_9ALVE|mmetsp:Transcript_45450/g.89529  ORF Transcript_45450/g.89529 Transcript_45450/m.89529 type:complete len:405 (-) Transcript_45450:67-1281(-)|eukprot:Cvel_9464.t1-p1 / transcript=Cvel_9464.t1 / gene=Cvel_9464 / organism=Chromera_velia_CCMP2878 / gene_product=Methionine aminopeptidase 1, putative / transcript_product=Methionine aminopeptidase 1, putative / location=Cvel_scaffold546:33460-39347(-) / protein_length=404 / sequence_SO=supercontig / SO=protein_coding / is_pseudo=false
MAEGEKENANPSSPGEQGAETENAPLRTCVGCSKEVSTTLSCPTCIKLEIPPSFFCTQECFKENWAAHKLHHKAAQNLKSFEEFQMRKFQNYTFSGKLRPHPITQQKKVPPHIQKPDYADTGVPESELRVKNKGGKTIEEKTKEQIERLREACKIGREALDLAHRMIKPGITADSIDTALHEFIVSKNGYPSPLNYHNFPKSVCTSVNEVICHGIPDKRPLEEGDIVNVDVTVFFKGMHGDLNETFFVGKVDEDSVRVVQGAYHCLYNAIKMCKPGVMYRELGDEIQKVAKKYGLSVVRTYCGHGLGELFHTAPNVPHYAKNKAIGIMRPGHTFTIEPMINLGVSNDRTWPDDWTAVTGDGKRSAQFEHTLLITETGVEVLTGRLPSSPPHDFPLPEGCADSVI